MLHGVRSGRLRIVHESPTGAEKSKARARTVMSNDIEDEFSKCSVCMKYQKSQHREPMLPHDIPDGRWQKIGMDIMTYNGRDHLVIVDYYSKYTEVSLLPDKTTSSIISYTKSVPAMGSLNKSSATTCPSVVVNSRNLPMNKDNYIKPDLRAVEWTSRKMCANPERYIQESRRGWS